MKHIIILLALFCGSLHLLNAQTTNTNPIDYLNGEWILKLTSVDPAPEDDSWKTVTRLLTFEPIHENNGLRQISYVGLEEEETFLFYDSGAETLYGMSVDANGYVWKSEMKIADDGQFEDTIAVPINDNSLKMVRSVRKVHENEMSFTYMAYKDGEVKGTASGVIYRIPPNFKN